MDLMGPAARKLRSHTRRSSYVLLLLAASVGHAQLAPSSSGLTQSAANNWAAQTGERVPWLTYSVDAGIGESDNVTLAPTNKVSQTLAITDLDFVAKEQSRLLDANAKGDFSYFDYLQNAYGGQLVGRFDGQGKVAIVPGRLIWVVEDSFGQAAIDPYVPVTPANMENINYFSTGPDLVMRVGSLNFIDLSLRYARAQYQSSPFDSNRGLGSLAIGRDISAGASVSLNADFERVMFDETGMATTGTSTTGTSTTGTVVNTDFDSTSLSGRYQLRGARTDLEADLGATRISQGNESTTGSLAKITLDRQLSAAAKLILTAGRVLTDASSSFSGLQSSVGASSGFIGTAPAPQTSSNYTSDYGSVGWQYVRNRTIVRLTARWERDTYPGQAQFDVTRPAGDFNIERQLTRTLSAQLIGRLVKTDFTNATIATNMASSDFNDWLFGGALTWRYGRGLEVHLRYNHSSHVVSAGGSGYGENRVFLTVGYSPRPTSDLQ